MQRAKTAITPDPNRLRFKDAFPTPIYRKSYFGATVTGATIVGAGLFSYATAGAGAPAAATGVSWVASMVAGGGAGSYMAGLSTVGGWFGGNAMVGSAILNGISVGIGGAGSSLAGKSLMGKIGIATSTSATMLDGIAMVQPANTQELEYSIHLNVPVELETPRTRDVLDLHEKLRDLLPSPLANLGASGQKIAEAIANALKEKVILDSAALLEEGADLRDLVVMAVLAHNHKELELFDQLMARAIAQASPKSAYVAYLEAIRHLQTSNIGGAKQQLEEALLAEPYAVEPAILLVNLLATEDFAGNVYNIRRIVDAVEDRFDSDKYQTPFSAASIHYRVGSLFLAAGQFPQAKAAFDSAHKQFGFIERRFTDSTPVLLVRIGQANALYGMGTTDEADALASESIRKAKHNDVKLMLRAAYAGNAPGASEN